MRKRFSFIFLLLFLTPLSQAQHLSYPTMVAKRVLIAGSYRNYQSALNVSIKVANAMGMTMSHRAMVYNSRNGLAYPENYSDEAFAGYYVARRYNEDCGEYDNKYGCVTVERSNGYEGFTNGYYIVVVGIYEDENEDDLQPMLNKLKIVVPDAYAKRTEIYMGCLH